MGRPRKPENRANAKLIQDAIEAKKRGLSYGVYVALYGQGSHDKDETPDNKEDY